MFVFSNAQQYGSTSLQTHYVVLCRKLLVGVGAGGLGLELKQAQLIEFAKAKRTATKIGKLAMIAVASQLVQVINCFQLNSVILRAHHCNMHLCSFLMHSTKVISFLD